MLRQKGKTNPIWKIIFCIDIIKVEADELWSFVKKKKNQRWLWYAINHDTGEILGGILKQILQEITTKK